MGKTLGISKKAQYLLFSTLAIVYPTFQSFVLSYIVHCGWLSSRLMLYGLSSQISRAKEEGFIRASDEGQGDTLIVAESPQQLVHSLIQRCSGSKNQQL